MHCSFVDYTANSILCACDSMSISSNLLRLRRRGLPHLPWRQLLCTHMDRFYQGTQIMLANHGPPEHTGDDTEDTKTPWRSSAFLLYWQTVVAAISEEEDATKASRRHALQ